jgi:integrase
MYRRPGRKVWYASLSDTEKHISLGTDDEDAAKIAFAALLERRRVSRLAPNDLPLADVFATAYARAETNNTTKTAYELHLNLNRILDWLEERSIVGTRQITREIVEDYKTARRFARTRKREGAEKGVSAARINRELDSWRRAMRIAVEQKGATEDVLAAFEKMREPRPEPHRTVHTKAQLERFLRAVAKSYRPLFRAVLGCGLRDEEMRHVAAEDVRRGEVVVSPKEGWTTKGYRHRRVPISAATRKALEAWIKVRDAGAVSTDKKRIWSIAQAAAKEAKVPPISLHELRHAWASHLYREGVPLKTLSMWLGHRDVATTERYLGVVEAALPAGTKLPW